MNTTSTPVVGTHGCYGYGADAYPCTVVEVSPSGHKVVIEQDDVTKWTPFPDSHGVEFARREGGPRRTFTRRANGRYGAVGSKRSGGVSFNGWYAHQDPSF